MRAFGYTILLLIFTFCANAQIEHAPDNIAKDIQEIKDDSVRMDSLYHYAGALAATRPHDAIYVSELLLNDAEKHHYLPGVAGAYKTTALAYEYLNDFPNSLKYYLEALRIQKELNRYSSQINSMLSISRLYDKTGDAENEQKYIAEALNVCVQNKTNDRVRRMQAVVTDYLAKVYKKQGRFDTAIMLYNDAIALAKRDSDSWQEMSSLCNLAIALKSNKNYEASLATYEKALALIDTANDTYAFSIILDNMAILFYQMDDLARSEQYSLKAINIANKTNDIQLLKDAYENLKNTYTKAKRYPEALEYFEKLSAIKDSVFNQEQSHQVKEMQAKYDTETKDKQIASQQTKIALNKKINLFLALIAVLLIIIGILMYKYLGRKKHLEEQKALQMQRQLEVKDRDNEIYRLRNVELKQSNDAIALQNTIIQDEKRKSEQLLLNILPAETADELLAQGYATSRKYELATVMFIDFVGFTVIAEHLSAEELVEKIDHYFGAFDNIILNHGLEKIKTIGDSYMCAGGLPAVNTTNPADVVNAAIDILNFVMSPESRHNFKVRIGINSGPLVAGVVGTHKFQYDIWGDTVNVASRIEENSVPGRINISGATYELVKTHFDCEHRGKIKAKNKAEMDMYFVNGKIA